MKKSEWFLAIFIMTMGIMCLIVSATSFQGMSPLQLGRRLATFCFWMVIVMAVIGVIYFLWKRKS